MALISKTLGPEFKCDLFGSDQTGLSVATSDVDIRLQRLKGDVSVFGLFLSNRMKDLVNVMIRNPEFICVNYRYSRYPIINAQHKRSGVDIQIVSAPSTSPQQALTRQYVDETPNLRPLYLLLRTVFGVRGLVDVFNGGTGSYGLLIMLLASLKRRSSNPPTTLGDQLFRFLDFYSNLDTSKYGVSLAPPKLFKKHDRGKSKLRQYIRSAHRRGDPVQAAKWSIGQRRLYQPYLLSLQDPANPLNDLGRKTNAIKHIQTTIRAMRQQLLHDMHNVEARSRRYRKKDYSILLGLVGRCHEVYYERRKKVEEYGLEVMRLKKEEMERGEKQSSRPQVQEPNVAVA